MNEVSILTLGCVCTAATSWFLVDRIRVLAPRFHLVDVPNERSSHVTPTPLGGGLGIIALNILIWAVIAVTHPVASIPHEMAFVLGAALIAGVSIVDDLRGVPVVVRFGAQGVAALVLVFGYAFWETLNVPLVGMVHLGYLGIPLTLIWIVGLTNAFNFMDGIDGMAGGLAVAAGIGWIILGAATGRPVMMVVGALIAASTLGFLIHNWHPASIFMGDAGATFLGYTFAALPILGARHDPRLALAGVLLVWPAIFDAGFTVARRFMQGENVLVGHRTFLFHRLVSSGWTHPAAAALYFPLPILGALLSFTWEKGTRPLHAVVLVLAVAGCVALWSLVRHQERRQERRELRAAEIAARALREGADLALMEDFVDSAPRLVIDA